MTIPMQRQVQDFIDQQGLTDRQERLLLAISGGLDSMVLGDVLLQLGYNIALAHANFQLRGQESDEDQHFVEQQAQHWQVAFYTQRFDTEDYARKRGISIQMAAREQRYQWFEDLVAEQGFDKIALAHHRSDLIETILLNLSRGTGLKGLRGFLPTTGNLIRPLFNCTKEEISAYAQQRGLLWREDSSNQNDYYQRNLIRHKVVPVLKQINPSLEQTMARNVTYLKEVERLLAAELSDDPLLSFRKTDQQLPVAELKQWTPLKWWAYFSQFGFNATQVEQIRAALETQPGAMFYSKDWSVNLDRTSLLLSKRALNVESRIIHNIQPQTWDDGRYSWELQICAGQTYQIDGSSSVGCWDLGKVTFPLTIRPWQEGDRFQPLGMTGTKKVSDFLIDRKVPRSQKQHVLVMLCGDVIIWLVGMQVDDRFKIDKNTTKVLEINRRPSAL